MAIDRQKQITVPGPAVVAPSRVGEQLIALARGGTQIVASMAQKKEQENEKKAAEERQLFDAELLQGFAQFDSEDGFDTSGFTQWARERAATKSGSMNQAVFLGSAQSMAQRRLSTLRGQANDREKRLDIAVANGKFKGIEGQVAQTYVNALNDARETGIEVDRHGMALELANSIGAMTEDAKTATYVNAINLFASVDADRFAAEKSEELSQAVRGFTSQTRAMLETGAPLADIDQALSDATRTLVDMGMDRPGIAESKKNWVIGLVADAPSVEFLERLENVNQRMWDAGQGRSIRDGLDPNEFRMVRQQREHALSREFVTQLHQNVEVWTADARSMDALKGVQTRLFHVEQSDPRAKAITAEDEAVIRMRLETRQNEIIAGIRSEMVEPVEIGVKEPYSAAMLARAASQLNWIAENQPSIKTLNGDEVVLVDKATHRRYADQLSEARRKYEESNTARLTVTQRVSSGQSLAQFEPDGPEAKALARMSAQRIEDGSTLAAEMVNTARMGLVPTEMIEQFGRTILPEGEGPGVAQEFQENFSAFAALKGMRSSVARQIEQANPEVAYLTGMEQMGLGRDELLRRVQTFGREKINAAGSLVEDQMAKRGGIVPNRNTPRGQMIRAQAIDNVLRSMDPIEGTRLQKQQQELGKAQGEYRLDEIQTIVDAAITSAEAQVETQTRTIPVYGREITLPRNGWTPDGLPERGKFDAIESDNINRQIMALVETAKDANGFTLRETEPSMFRGGLNRRVVVRPDSLESVYNPETGRVSWRMRVDYVPGSTFAYTRFGPLPNVKEKPGDVFQARTLGWISLMQERE